MRAALLALLVMTLAACEAFPPGAERSGPAPDREAEAATEAVQTDPEGAPAPEATRPAPLPPRPSAPPPRGRLDAERLTGLTTEQAWELLGPPSDVKQESPAIVWTYAVAGCRLELFFYFDLESQEQRTLALDLEPGDERVGSRATCLHILAGRGQAQQPPKPAAGVGAEVEADTWRAAKPETWGETGK